MEIKSGSLMDAFMLPLMEANQSKNKKLDQGPIDPNKAENTYVWDEEANKKELEAVKKNEAINRAKGHTEKVSTKDRQPMDVVGKVVPKKEPQATPLMPKLGETHIPSSEMKETDFDPEATAREFEMLKAPVDQEAEKSNLLASAKQEMEKLTEKYPNFWVGAAPLLMGAFMGDLAAGAKAGSEGLLQRYKDERDFELAKLKAKKEELKKNRRFQLASVERDGKTFLEKFDTSEGTLEGFENPVLAGYKQTYQVDPTSKELVRGSGAGTLTRIAGTAPRELTVKEQEESRDFREKVLGDKEVIKARSTLTATGTALAALESGNSIFSEGVKTIFPRMFGEVGNLAAAEQERFSGSQAFTRRFEKLKKKISEGTLTEDDRADLMEVAQVMRAYADRQLKGHISKWKKSETPISGEKVTKSIDPFIDPVPADSKKVVKIAKSKDPTIGEPKYETLQSEKGPDYVDIFQIMANGEYEYVKTVRKK